MAAILADDIFKCIFLNEKDKILIQISLKLVSGGPIDNKPALVQVTVWRRSATSHYLNQWWLVYWRIYASLGLDELREHGYVWYFTRLILGLRPANERRCYFVKTSLIVWVQA